MTEVINEIEIEAVTINLISGDKNIIYAVGPSEAEISEEESFEVKALPYTLGKNKDLNIKEFINTIYDKLSEFRGSEKSDDVCNSGIEIL